MGYTVANNTGMNTSTSSQAERRSPWLTQPEESGLLRLNPHSVLIADDQADSIDALAILLEWSGLEVHVAPNGPEALRAARQYLPALVFLDIAMPGLNGYEVCRQLRSLPEFAEARIYAITAFTGEPHETRSSEAGFTGQLTKPFDVAALEALVRH